MNATRATGSGQRQADAVRRPRVLVVGSAWPPETFLARLIRGLADAGMDVIVPLSGRPRDGWESRAGLTWLPAPHWGGPLPLRLARLAGLWLAAIVRSPREAVFLSRWALTRGGRSGRLQMLNRLAPFAGVGWDAVYFPWNLAAADYEALLDMGRPGVVSCRGSQIYVAPHDPRRPDLREQLRVGFEKAAAVHCVSRAILEEARQYGLDPARAVVIRPAVDPLEFHPDEARARSSAQVEVISTGALRWVKGYEYALLAIRRLLDAGVGVRYRIVGDGPERARLLYTIRDLRLEGQVELAGRLAPGKVREALQRADIFLLPSVSEGISNSALEAMSCGLPAVTTACGGMAEAVREGVDGFLVPVRDPAAIAEALRRLATSPDLRRRMGESGRERIRRDFRLEEQVASFVGLFERVTA